MVYKKRAKATNNNYARTGLEVSTFSSFMCKFLEKKYTNSVAIAGTIEPMKMDVGKSKVVTSYKRDCKQMQMSDNKFNRNASFIFKGVIAVKVESLGMS